MRARTVQLNEPIANPVVLYDGHCNFCVAQTENLRRIARPQGLTFQDFQDPSVLANFDGLDHQTCMAAMQLIMPDGRLFSGFEAAVHAVATRRGVGWIAYGYYIPGVRQLCDFAYARVAARRYEIAGRKLAEEGCEGGTCSLHFAPTDATNS